MSDKTDRLKTYTGIWHDLKEGFLDVDQHQRPIDERAAATLILAAVVEEGLAKLAAAVNRATVAIGGTAAVQEKFAFRNAERLLQDR